MNRAWVSVLILAVISACARRQTAPDEKPKAFGTAVVSVSGDKQVAEVGSLLDQPLVIQVNDGQGAAVAGASVRFTGPNGMVFQPDHGLTGPDGQFTTNVTLGGIVGHYEITTSTVSAAGKPVAIQIDEIALGYQETLGKKIYEIQCIRCHDSESTPERVSNHDNLDPQPHSFTNGAVLNAMSDADLMAIISQGGPALRKSPEMPPYGNTLSKAEMDALVAYIRAVADPPYRPQGVFYAGN